MRWLGIAGVYTPRDTIIVRRPYASAAWLLAHEQCHHRQRLRYGWLGFWTRVIVYTIRHGYERSPLEREAREAEHGSAQAQKREQVQA